MYYTKYQLLLPGWLCQVRLSMSFIMGDVIIVPISMGCYTRTRPGSGPCLSWACATVWAVTIAFYDNLKTFWYWRGTPAFHNGVSNLPRKSHENRRVFFVMNARQIEILICMVLLVPKMEVSSNRLHRCCMFLLKIHKILKYYLDVIWKCPS